MADYAQEVTVREGLLRVEITGTEADGAGCIRAYLNGEPITRERAEELVAHG